MGIADIEVQVMAYSDISDDDKVQIFELRKEAFIDRRGWSIATYAGGSEESDQYDDTNSTYIFVSHGGFISGCVRIRPSFLSNITGRYFGKLREGSMSNLIGSEECLIWEASRFAIREAPNQESRRVRGVDVRTILLFRETLRVARKHGIQYYEVVVDDLMKKVLQRVKWDFTIFSTGLGSQKENIFYGWLSCSDMQYEKINSLLAGNNFTPTVDIKPVHWDVDIERKDEGQHTTEESASFS